MVGLDVESKTDSNSRSVGRVFDRGLWVERVDFCVVVAASRRTS